MFPVGRCDRRGGATVMTSIAELAGSFIGAVLEPGATGFEEARKIHNGLIDRRPAVVEGGVLWKEFNREAQLHGLATTGGVIGTTGVAGLTLGGGIGWLMTKYGMALDNLISVNMVLADGSVARASADENFDL